MMRYVAVIPRLARAERRAPAPDWRAVHAGDQVSIWTAPAGEVGRGLSDGYCLGTVSGGAATVADVASSWGAYVAISEGCDGVSVWRDPSGRIPAYCWRGRDIHVVCSHLEDLATYLPAPLSIDWPTLIRQMMGDYMPGRRTGFAEVQEVLPGEILLFAPNAVHTRAFWDPASFWTRPHRNALEAVAASRRAAEEAVGFWGRRYDRVMMDLSGGLDSSAVLGLLAALPDRPQIIAFNGRTGRQESDERSFARRAAKAAGVPLIEANLGATLTDFATRPRPPLQPRPTMQMRGAGLDPAALPVARQHDLQAYFTGRGGDHLFYAAAPPTVAHDRVLSPRGLIALPRTAYSVARATRQPFSRIIREALRPPQAARSLAEIMPLANPFVTAEAAATAATSEAIHPWAASALASAPIGKVLLVCHLVELQRHHDRIGRAETLDEAHPFISQPMMEASLRTPSDMFLLGGAPRGLQRAVFRDVLPPEILARRTKGATTSHSTRVLLHNLPYLRERLLDGELVAQGLLDRPLLESQLTQEALISGRFRPALAECVTAQLWLEDARSTLSGSSPRPAHPP